MRRLRFLLICVLASLVALGGVVLYVYYPNALRDQIVRPAIRAYYIGRYYLDFVPQSFLWLLPPGLAVVIVVRRLIRQSKRERSARMQASGAIYPEEGELAQLARQISSARHSRFARVRVSRAIAEIAARMVAGRERLPLHRAKARMADGYWRGNDNTHHFLTPRRHYTARQTGHEFQGALQRTIEHLEAYDRQAERPRSEEGGRVGEC